MAITKIGPPLAGIRGTIGGITYSENLSGTYAKLWSIGSNPRTSKQSVERGYLGRMPALWNALSDAQRAAWRTFAADPAQELENPLGEAYYASGYNWFCKCNVRLLRVGRAPIQPVPTQARPAAPTIDDFRVCEAGAESDLCVCGVATASTTDGVFFPTNAFDDDLNTHWTSAFGNTTGWLRYDLCDAANVKHYAIYPGPAPGAGILPKDWNFQVFTAAAWTTIHAVTNMVFVAGWNHFYCANPYTETDYRLNITANNGHPNHVRVFEMEYYAGDKGSSVVIYPEDNFEDAPSYDLVLHVSMGGSIGMDVQYPGYMETLAMQSPGRWYELCHTELEAIFGTILTERTWFARLHRQTTEGLRSSAATERAITLDC